MIRAAVRSIVRGAVAVAAGVVTTIPAHATVVPPTRFTEDFTTVTWRHAAATTAVWDTTQGVLRMPGRVISTIGQFVPSSGHAVDAFTDGHIVYLAAHSAGVYRIDVSDPTAPAVLGHYDTPGIARAVVGHSGNVAFVADDTGGVVVLVWDGTTLAGTATWNSPGHAYGLALHGTELFVADDNGGVARLDVSNPLAPRVLASTTGPLARHLAVSGDRLFVASVDQRLWIYDISDTSSFTLLSSVDVGDELRAVDGDGNLVWLAAYTTGVVVYDVTDPTAPVHVTTIPTPDRVLDVEVHGTLACIVDYAQGYRLVDVTNPTAPVEISHTRLGPYSWTYMYTATLAGDLVFATDWSTGLHVDRVRNAPAPMSLASTAPGSFARHVAFFGTTAFVSTRNGIEAWDLRDPSVPVHISTIAPDPYHTLGRDLVIHGDRLFTFDESGVSPPTVRLQEWDVSDPASPTRVTIGAVYATGDSTTTVAVHGHTLFVGSLTWNGQDGLGTIDLSDPASPTVLGTWRPPAGQPWGVPTSMAFSGDLAFVAIDASTATRTDGVVWIVDVGDPATPTGVTWISMTPDAAVEDVTVAGGYLLAACGTEGLRVYDVSTPSAPALVYSDTHPWASAVSVVRDGNRAFVAFDGRLYNAGGDLRVYDVTDPSAPTLVHDLGGAVSQFSSLSILGDALLAAGHQAYRNVGTARLDVVRVWDEEAVTPETAQSLALTSPPWRLARVRLDPVTNGGPIDWWVSADAGATWQAVTPGQWESLTATGGSLLAWRAELQPVPGGTQPECQELTLDWSWAEPFVTLVSDVPGDNGGAVRVRIVAAGHDAAGDPDPVAYYRVFEQPAWIAGAAWTVVDSFAATQAAEYVRTVPTQADSNASDPHLHRFRVEAVTAGAVTYVSPVDSGYSVDLQPPDPPFDVTVRYNAPGGNVVTWSVTDPVDNAFTMIYRDTVPNFVPGSNLVTSVGGATTTYTWTDPDFDRPGVYYALVAADPNGNTSGPVYPGLTTATHDTPALEWSLDAPVPNPFNTTTRIGFTVPAGGDAVRLDVFDVAGRHVRTLVDRRVAAGRYAVPWNGRDDRGRPVASGVYFCRLDAPGLRAVRRMVLLK